MKNPAKKPVVNKNERRFVTGIIETRAADDPDKMPVIFGYAALFDTDSEDMGFIESIATGAFDKALGDDVRCLFNHNPDFVLGRTTSKTLTLRVDNRGLYFECQLPETNQARDLVVSLNRGDVNQMSFGFRTINNRWDEDGETMRRVLLEVKLYDVSPVTFAAYPQTDVALRSMEHWQESNQPELPNYSMRKKRLRLIEAD